MEKKSINTSIEQERKWKRHFRKWFDKLDHWPSAEEIEKYLQEHGVDRWLADEELRKGIATINQKYKALSTENKRLRGEIPLLNKVPNDEPSVATEAK